jgi:peptidoglycan/xylan/chitin deacetylase (PgdA/CDA1 family)
MDLDLFFEGLTRACGISWSKSDEREAARRTIMSWDDVCGLSRAGMDVQSHSRSHRVLQTVPDDQLSDELLGSRLDIEKKVGQVCDTIAYPVGRVIVNKPRLHDAVIAAGYKLGFTNQPGRNPTDGSLDPFDWCRYRIDGDMPPAVVRGVAAFPRLAT